MIDYLAEESKTSPFLERRSIPSGGNMLTPITRNIWGFEHDHFMPGGLHFRGRTTVLRLPSGGLLLHSPNPVCDPLAAELEALGPVEVLVAPNSQHHVHFGPATERWPDARRWGAPTLVEARADLHFHHTLGRDTPAWGTVFTPHTIAGIPWLDETVFFHAETGSLVVTDLFFHIQRPANWQSRLFFWLYGLSGRPAQSPIVRMMAKDKPAAGRSAHTLLQLPVTRLVPAHGPVIEEDAASVLRRVLTRQARWAPAALTSSD